MYYRPFEREVLFADEVLIFLDDRIHWNLPPYPPRRVKGP